MERTERNRTFGRPSSGWKDNNKIDLKYSRTELIGINQDGEASCYAENPDNWKFFKNNVL